MSDLKSYKSLNYPMFEPKASFYCLSEASCLSSFQLRGWRAAGEALLDHERIGGFYPTLSEIKQIKLLEQACEKASSKASLLA